MLSVPILNRTVLCYADFDITDPLIGCQQLAGLLKYWKAGTAYIQQLSCLTQLTRLSCYANYELGSLDALQQLSLLRKLKLSRPSAVLRDVHTFKYVQSLRLKRVEGEVCNLESYTQLIHLRISIKSEDTVKEVLLPSSDGVKLCRLEIWGPSHEHNFHLRNLTLATCLKDINLCYASPQNFEQADLSALPFLTQLRVARPECAWLQTLTLCSSLQSLHVFDYEQPTLPSSFSLLTNLRTLSVSGCSFDQFPDCLLHLSHLESLSVSCDKSDFHLSDRILCLAKWPYLRYLDISVSSQRSFPVESQLLLGQLQKQLRDCSSSCKFTSSHP